MAINFTSDVGKVRLLIADLNEAALLLSDELVQGYLDLNDGDRNRAAADALDAIAMSEVLVSKKIRTQDLSTDGPAVAAELRAQAARLRAKADALDEDAGSFFDIVAFGHHTGPEGAERRL